MLKTDKTSGSTVAVVIGRKNSKRIPRKNIKDFCGKPLATYPIVAATACNLFNRVYVSSDDLELLALAENYHAIPIKRSNDLADDKTPTIPVVRDIIKKIEDFGPTVGRVCCLYAANPFVQAAHISEGYNRLSTSDSHFVFSAVKYSYPIERGFVIGPDGLATMLNPSAYDLRTQDCRDVYHDADLYYWGSRDSWMNESAIFGEYSYPVIYPGNLAFPIDTMEDWDRAEAMFNYLQIQNA